MFRLHCNAACLAFVLALLLMPTAEQVNAESALVTITEIGNNPRVLTVETGSQVAWLNRGAQPHTATSSDGMWDSGRISVGGQFQFSFNQPGRYRYNCNIHPRISGEIIVEGGVISPPPPSVPPSTSPPAPPPATSIEPTRPITPPTATPTPTPTPVPPLVLHLANARYEAQPFSKLQESSPVVAEFLPLFPSRTKTEIAAGPFMLSVPAGARTAASNLLIASIKVFSLPPPPGYSYLGTPYEVASADGSVLFFRKPLEISFAYSPKDLLGAHQESLRIAAWDSNAGLWRLLLSKIDARRYIVTARTDRLTIFALVADTIGG